MIDFTKAYCSLHPHELVTNFCNKDQCLTPLCANCICTHTDSHVEKGTSPDYQNIRTTYKKIQQHLQTQINLFENQKQRIAKVSTKIQEKRRKLREVIELAREQVETFLRNYFEEKEKRMLREIQNQQKNRGLHCQTRLQQLNSFISREITTLINASEDMTSNTFLQSLPRIRTQVLANSEALHKQINQEVNHNQNFTTTLTYDSTYLNHIQNLIDKSIQLIYSRPNEKFMHGDNLRMNENQKINRNAQSQITFMKPKSQQLLYHDKSLDHSYVNNQLVSFSKENQIYPRIMAKPNFTSPVENRGELKRNSTVNNAQDPKISLLKVSEDHRKSIDKNNNLYQTPISQTKTKLKDQNLNQSSKKLRKLGLKVIANSETDHVIEDISRSKAQGI